MGCRVILRKRFIRFADFVRHRHFDWRVYTGLIISLRGFLHLRGPKQQGRGNLGWKTIAFIELVGSSLVSLAWHSKCGYPACKLLWPLLQWACISIFQTYGQKTKTRFFSLFVCHRRECQAENVTRFSELPKLSELDRMKSALIGSSLNGPGSTSC